jgi:hypothetical protein
MTTSYSPRSPRLLRGAIVGIDPFNPVASVIVFQYNPDTLTRSVQAQVARRQEYGNRAEPMRLAGAPTESIGLEVEIDATDQLERGDEKTADMGIYPQLSALEMLLYPKTLAVVANTALALMGVTEWIPTEAPMTLFVWGIKRVVPVRLTGVSITEEAHDVNLNPIRAKVSLDLRVLSYNDFPVLHAGYALFLAHQVAKEVMATTGSLGDLRAVTGGNVKLI